MSELNSAPLTAADLDASAFQPSDLAILGEGHIAYVRPFIITLLSPKEATEFTFREPSPRAMGCSSYMVYAFILTLLHHLYLTFLEWLDSTPALQSISFDTVDLVLGTSGSPRPHSPRLLRLHGVSFHHLSRDVSVESVQYVLACLDPQNSCAITITSAPSHDHPQKFGKLFKAQRVRGGGEG